MSGTVASILHVFCHLVLTEAPRGWSYPFWGRKMNFGVLRNVLAGRTTAHATGQQRGRHSRSLVLSDSEALLGITELSSPLWLFKPCVLCLLFLSSNSSVFSKEVSRGPVPGAPLCSCRLLHTRLHTCFFSPRRLCFSESLHHQPGPWQTGVSPINN